MRRGYTGQSPSLGDRTSRLGRIGSGQQKRELQPWPKLNVLSFAICLPLTCMSATALDRQIRAIYGEFSRTSTFAIPSWFTWTDSLETGSPKTALVSCNKLLKKQPKNNLVKVRAMMSRPISLATANSLPWQALKALALVRSQKTDEAIVLCDEVLATRCTDDATLSAMQHVLRGLGRRTNISTIV